MSEKARTNLPKRCLGSCEMTVHLGGGGVRILSIVWITPLDAKVSNDVARDLVLMIIPSASRERLSL